MLSPRPKIRPEMRRSQSVTQMSSFSLNLGRGNTVGMDDSMSDMSMDTCFRPARRDDEDEFSDESDYELTEKRRSYRNSDPKTMNSMVVSSHRDLGVFSALQPPPFTNMQGMDESNTSLGFDSPGYMYRKPTMTRNEQKLGSFEERVRQDILTSKELFNQAVERGENSMRNRTKSREFEDLLGAGSIRNLDNTVHDFLVSDSDRGPGVAKETKRDRNEIDWDRVDAKAKQTLKAYDGHEGNLFPEITHHEAQKFSKSGNAWLEGRYATTADWKRDATGMTLEVPHFKDKEEKSGQPIHDKDRSVQSANDKDTAGQPTFKPSKPHKPKTKPRTELTMKVTAAAKPLANDSSQDLSPSISDEPLQIQFSQADAPKDIENRRRFFRNNSLSSFKINVSRRFKRTPSLKSDDEGPLLATSSFDRVSSSVGPTVRAAEGGQSRLQTETVQEYNTSSGSLSVLSSRVSVASNESLDPNGSGGADGSLNPLSFEKRTKRRKSKSDKGGTKDERSASSGRPGDGTSDVPDRGHYKKERPTKEGKHKTKRRGSRSSFGSSDGNFSELAEEYHEPIREAKSQIESEFQTSGLRRIKSLEILSPPQHHTEPSMLRREARTVSRYESAPVPDTASNLPSSTRKEAQKMLRDKPTGGFSTDDGSVEPRKHGSESLPKSRRKRSDSGDYSAVSTAGSIKGRRQSRGSVMTDEEHHYSSESLHGAASVEADHKAATTRVRSRHRTASPVRGSESPGADPDSSLKSSSKTPRDHRRRNKELGTKRRHRSDDKHKEESDLDISKGTTTDLGTRSERASESGGHDGRQKLGPEHQMSSSMEYENGAISTGDGMQHRLQVELRSPCQKDESREEVKKDLRRRRSSSVPRSTAKLKSITSEENRSRVTGHVARENRAKRRSSSVERGAEKAFFESRRGSKERSPARHAISHRRRSSSVPRRAEKSAPSTYESINEFGDDNESRPLKASNEQSDSYAISVPHRGRSMGVASSSQEQSDVHDPAHAQGAALLQAPRTPRRRRSVERPLTTPGEEDLSRPRRRRSHNPGGGVVTAEGGEEQPRRRRSLTPAGEIVSPEGANDRLTTPGQKQTELHQNGQSSNGEKQRTKTTPASSSASKPSFLSRIGARFEAETIKPLEKRNMRRQRAQQLKQLLND